MATSFMKVGATRRNYKNTSKKRDTTIFKDLNFDQEFKEIDEIFKDDINDEVNTFKGDLELLQNNILTNSNLINELTSSPSQIFADKEIPIGNINGVNDFFVLSHIPIEGSEHVYLNGLLQESGVRNDYIISDSDITFLTPPEENSKIRCTYYYNT